MPPLRDVIIFKREVIYVDDIANACIFFMGKKIKQTIINIGTGKDYTIRDYAKLILKLIIPNKKIKIKYDPGFSCCAYSSVCRVVFS